jgi:uncharacterized OsmC-like protein/predicted DsbA family dithiol-disulfide isomerase
MGHFDERHATLLSDPVNERDHARGPSDAPVTLVEYGDFACPHCRAAYATIKDLLVRMPEVRFVFRANPRSHLFPQAEPAAEAAEFAGAHGKFWEMHDRLFEAKEGDLSRARLVAMAGEVGLDVASFARELDAGTYKAAVHAEEVSGWHSHVLSTPTFFINGIRFDDSIDRLANAVVRANRQAESLQATFREARVRSTEHPRKQIISIGRHEIVADLQADEEGEDAGPGPHDFLLVALGACTAMTVQWWAQHHRMNLEHVGVRLTQSRSEQGHLFRVSVDVTGDLSEADRAQLQHAADACPVARTLTHEIAVETRIRVDRRVDEAGEESFPASDPPPWTGGG